MKSGFWRKNETPDDEPEEEMSLAQYAGVAAAQIARESYGLARWVADVARSEVGRPQ